MGSKSQYFVRIRLSILTLIGSAEQLEGNEIEWDEDGGAFRVTLRSDTRLRRFQTEFGLETHVVAYQGAQQSGTWFNFHPHAVPHLPMIPEVLMIQYLTKQLGFRPQMAAENLRSTYRL